MLLDPVSSFAQQPSDPEYHFLHPPSSAYPHAYWFWMNGNVSRRGITLDLEAMKEAGIGGVFNFDVGTGIPNGPVEYFSNEWLALKKHAVEEAARLGIEFTLHNCPGFSASGGPWISPEHAMQQITWSETFVQGGGPVTLTLPTPNSKLDYYKDIAVLAFPSLSEEALMQTVKVSTNSGAGDAGKMNSEGITAHALNGAPAWIQFEFARPFSAKLITFYIAGVPAPDKRTEPETGERTSVTLESSVDGKHFTLVTPINTGVESELQAGDKYIVYDIPPTTARYYRISCTQSRRYRQVRFSGIERLQNWLEKTNARPRNIVRVEDRSAIEKNNLQQVPADSITDYDSIVDITSNMDTSGTLQWNAPPGNWSIIRIGYTPTGAVVQAAPHNGRGLECDKFSNEALTLHFEHMMEKWQPMLRLLAGKGKPGVEIDSYEAGAQNWTPGFEQEFEKRCGYSLLKYLPVLAGGRIITSAEISERFTWDLRRVQAALMTENYYGRFCELCRQNGFITYIEPYDSGPMEEMQAASEADMAMGEFWYGISTAFPVDNPIKRTPKLASSVTHIHGRNIAAAEAFTAEPDASRWLEYPFALKAAGDQAFAQGINRLVIHCFAHQPHPTAAPGMTMGPWGIHFDRTNTWWKPGSAWIQYLQRCQYLLQQGKPVADLLYFTGEDANMYTRALPEELFPAPPAGYDYDLVNAPVVLNDITIINNRIYLPGGTTYAVFVLQNFKAISFPLLKKLHSLVRDGMLLVGDPPGRPAGLMEDPDNTFQQLVEEIWGENKSWNKGKVFRSTGLDAVLRQLRLAPDFYCSDPNISFCHREMEAMDIYFLCNRLRSYQQWVATFRIKNKMPEIWDPATGRITPVGVFENAEEGIRMPVQLEPYGSFFVVFRNKKIPVSIHSILKDGREIFGTKPADPSAFNVQPHQKDFTLLLWARPEMNILLESNLAADSKAPLSTQHYAIYPWRSEGNRSSDHAAAGLTIGRNGIAIWENNDGMPYMALSIPVAIEGWSHIAVCYNDNTPAVYLNGVFLKKGIKSRYKIDTPLFDQATHECDYKGGITLLQLFERVLTDTEITAFAKRKPIMNTPLISPQLAGSSEPAVLLKENGNYQFVFSDQQKRKYAVKDIQKKITLKGPWQVQFPAGSGAPEKITLQELASLHRHPHPGVQYFSGTATYSFLFPMPEAPIKGKHWFLDLGEVAVIAEVMLNGKSLGIVWKQPFQLEITGAMQPGLNRLVIEVTNQWTNRLIGDEQLPDPDRFTPFGGSSGIPGITGGGIEKIPGWYTNGEPQPENGRITFSTWKHYSKDSPLAESGLIGPVTLIQGISISLSQARKLNIRG